MSLPTYPTPSFQKAQRSDLKAIVANEVAAYQPGWSKQLLSDCIERSLLGDDYEVWLMCIDGISCGHMVLLKVLDEYQLLNVCVLPKYQGQGLGKAWMEFLLCRLQQQKMATILLEVRVSNQRAINLYSATGFGEIGKRKGYYPSANGREDALVMKYCLALQSNER